jgi:hypothetical protein
MTRDNILSVGTSHPTSEPDQLATPSEHSDPPDAEIDHRQATP